MKSITFKATEAKGPVIVLIGRRDTGKSYLGETSHHRDVPIGTVISGTEAGNGFTPLTSPSSSTTSIIAC
jgi:hypothetical protein